MAKVLKETMSFEIEVKRFYMDGFKIISNCPKCNSKNILDLSVDYLSYPIVNEMFEEYVYCENCDHKYATKLILKLDLEIVKD